MSHSSEGELKELLRHQVNCKTRNFQNRPLFNIENPREFQKKCLPVDASIHLLKLIGLRLKHRTRRTEHVTTLSISCFLFFFVTVDKSGAKTIILCSFTN